jgi:YihY family inner membrane protein
VGRGDRGGRGGNARRSPVQPRPGGGAGATLTALGLRRSKSSTGADGPRRSTRFLRAFWHRAYEENITGLAGMVAYNLVLFLFPFALLVLFIFGRILQSPSVEASVLSDLQRLFPAVETNTLDNALTRIRDSSTTIGVAAAVGALWIGTSFWGAMDTAFCRIYHVPCRGWLEQKRFALVMLLGLTLFLAGSVVVPTLEAVLVTSADNLPFGLSDISGLANALLLVAALLAVFVICCVIYYLVPKGHIPWRGIWPGALFVTLTTGVANAVYPFYLANVSSIGEVGGTIGFILIALVWFYLVSLSLMAGAVINSLRYELYDTGTMPTEPQE